MLGVAYLHVARTNEPVIVCRYGRTDLPLPKVLDSRDRLESLGFTLPELPIDAVTVAKVRTKLTAARHLSSHPRQARPFSQQCAFLGSILNYEPCSCGSADKLIVYNCHAEPKRCVLTNHDRSQLADPDLRRAIQSCENCPFKQTTPRFITTSQLWEDATRLASLLPAETSRIVGVARSGLNVATMIAMLLHRPLSIVR